MNEPISESPTKRLSPFSHDEFVKSDTASLLKMAGVIASVPKALTAAELIEINKSRVFDCARLGVTKEQTAKLIAADPRNTKALSSRTIMRDLNRVVGDWKALARQHLASDQTFIPENQNVSSISRSTEMEPQIRNKLLIDTNFNEEDII